jgi:tetratricopeptide (TPR) repeat protein
MFSVLFVVVLSLSTHVVAEEVKPDTDPDATEIIKRIATVEKQISENVDKIYAAEGGKRDKQEIRNEYIFNSILAGMAQNIEDHLTKQEFDKVHEITNTTSTKVIQFKQENPRAMINPEKLAYIYGADGDTYFSQGMPEAAIAAYTKSLEYKEDGSIFFQLGYAYMIKKETEKGKQYFDKALLLDKSLESNYSEAMDYLKQQGIIK